MFMNKICGVWGIVNLQGAGKLPSAKKLMIKCSQAFLEVSVFPSKWKSNFVAVHCQLICSFKT